MERRRVPRDFLRRGIVSRQRHPCVYRYSKASIGGVRISPRDVDAIGAETVERGGSSGRRRTEP
jgi:hypothetical protein